MTSNFFTKIKLQKSLINTYAEHNLTEDEFVLADSVINCLRRLSIQNSHYCSKFIDGRLTSISVKKETHETYSITVRDFDSNQLRMLFVCVLIGSRLIRRIG